LSMRSSRTAMGGSPTSRCAGHKKESDKKRSSSRSPKSSGGDKKAAVVQPGSTGVSRGAAAPPRAGAQGLGQNDAQAPPGLVHSFSLWYPEDTGEKDPSRVGVALKGHARRKKGRLTTPSRARTHFRGAGSSCAGRGKQQFKEKRKMGTAAAAAAATTPCGGLSAKREKDRRSCSVDGCYSWAQGARVPTADACGPPGRRCNRHGGRSNCSIPGCGNMTKGRVPTADAFGPPGARCRRHNGGTRKGASNCEIVNDD